MVNKGETQWANNTKKVPIVVARKKNGGAQTTARDAAVFFTNLFDYWSTQGRNCELRVVQCETFQGVSYFTLH